VTGITYLIEPFLYLPFLQQGRLQVRKLIIVAVMFCLALAYQNNHRDFGPARIEAVR
jgi:hypothetical protein